MDLLIGGHALGQARERGISVNEIRKAIQQGAKHIQKPNKIVADYGHVRVVYKKIKSRYFVITVMIRK